MRNYILNERVLSDDTLHIADEGKVFKGGYIAIVQQYEFANSCSDRPKEPIRFRSEKRLANFLAKNYPKFDY